MLKEIHVYLTNGEFKHARVEDFLKMAKRMNIKCITYVHEVCYSSHTPKDLFGKEKKN